MVFPRVRGWKSVTGGSANLECDCQGCRKQTSLIAGTLFQSIHLALTNWFLAIYLISQANDHGASRATPDDDMSSRP